MVGRRGLIHTASDAANAAKLVALGITATPATPWTGTQQMTVGPHAFHWDGATWQPGAAGAVNAAPGSSYGARNDITAADAANASKLADLQFTATPSTAWTSTLQITVGPHAFHWDGTAWQPGAAGAVNAAPGSSYGARNDITAADAANANKLGNLGFTPTPSIAWTATQQMTIGAHAFHWDGATWQPGPA